MYEEGVFADVAPSQAQCFTRTKTCIGKDRDERAVARTKRRAHPLDRRWGECLHLLSPRTLRLPNSTGGILRQASSDERVFKDRPEQLDGMPDRHLTGPLRQTLGLPAADHLSADLA